MTSYDVLALSSPPEPEDRHFTPTTWEPSTSEEWQESQAVSQSTVNRATYFPAVGEPTGGDVISLFYDGGAGTNNSKATTATLEDPFNEVSASGAQYSIYATYEEGGEPEVQNFKRRRGSKKRRF